MWRIIFNKGRKDNDIRHKIKFGLIDLSFKLLSFLSAISYDIQTIPNLKYREK